MPGTFTIDFQDRTRASIVYEAVPPRSGDAWTEMLYHVAFCVGRTLVNLELEERVEYARKFDAWVGSGFADFPVHVAPPAVLTPCARFVSSFDGDVPSYTRGAYGFGLNARGLDYYGPMAAAVLLRHVHDAWDRAEDLLQPVRALCRRVVAEGVDEAGHVVFVTDCVTEALKNFERRGIRPAVAQMPLPDLASVPMRAEARGKSRRNTLAVAGVTVMLVTGLALYLRPSPPMTVPAPVKQPPAEAPSQTAKAVIEKPPARDVPSAAAPAPVQPPGSVKANQPALPEVHKAEERQAVAPPPARKEETRADVLKRQEEDARQAEAARRRAEEERVAAVKKDEEERKRAAESARKKAEEESRKASEERFVEMKRQQEERERQRLAELKLQEEARVPRPSPPPALSRQATGKDGAPMVLVPAGEFLMGNQAEDDAPPHRVYLDAFYIDRQEVTNARYLKFVEATRHRAPQHVVDPQYDLWAGTALTPGVADLPVVNVDWSDADAYCRWAGKRLPTEAEWEKAARGTDGRLYPWGNEAPNFARLNFSRHWQGAHTIQPVGSYESGSSPYGAQDMAGNVWEWVSDWYDAGSYAAGPARNPQGPASGSSKILRGGSWTNSADGVRATHRREEDPDMRNSDSGFRCARGAN